MGSDLDLDTPADAALISILRLLLVRRSGRPGARDEPGIMGLALTARDVEALERIVRQERGTGIAAPGSASPETASAEASWRRRTIDRAWLHVETHGIAALLQEAAERTASGFLGNERR